MTLSIDPIVAWPWIAAGAAVVTALTLWAYAKRLRDSQGRWRWVALSLRLLAVLMCVLASLRPMVLFQKKDKQTSTLAFLTDASTSMTVGDEAGGRKKRWTAAREALAEGLKAAKDLGKNVQSHTYRFSSTVSDDKPDDLADPKGTETALGSALEETLKRQTGGRVLALVLLSDGSNNAGRPPSLAAARLKAQGVPVVAVGFGTQTAGASKDLAVRSMNAGPTVYVKNEMGVSGMIGARGFAGREIEVELLVEGESTPVDRKKIRVPEKATEVPVTGLKWTPTKSGETRVALRVKEEEGEAIKTNNVFSSFVTVLGGGLNVLYLAGPTEVWETRYLVRALDASQKIQVTQKKLVRPAEADMDADFAPNAYDVYILGDLPADFLTDLQQKALVRAVVNRGAGLMMLGGRSSFGAGGWAGTDIGNILPTAIGPGDGQIEPLDGLKVVPNPLGLDSYVLKLAGNPAESRRIWESLPPLRGANRLGQAKPAALIWVQSPDGEPLMVGEDGPGKGRVIEFGGETWPWARFSEESRLAHLKFWRQAILWLAHKEDQNDSQVQLVLDRRRAPVGGRIELSVLTRDAKGEPLPGLKFETTITRDGAKTPPERGPEVFGQSGDAKGTLFVTGPPGDARISVTAKDAAGKVIGTDSARLIAYQDDRELENPAADLNLLRQVADLTGGKYLAPEQLGDYLKTLDKDIVSEYITQREVRVWDNWYFLLIFTILLTTEWWLRKRHGWV